MADRTGQQLGNYRLVRLLGEGAFAEVYLGEHIHLGTQAAIKLLHTQLVSDDDTDKFRTEARTVARLVHPHIIRVLDFGIEGKTPFLVMDYAPNGTLRHYHPRGKPLPMDTIITYVKQIAEALQCAHDEKLVHRDIKPENMLLSRRNEVLLGDFGIALMAQSSRHQSMQDMAGTMTYMAPEQIQGKPRPASDQYALGVVVYEWLTGGRPFEGSFMEVITQHLTTPPPPIREKNPSISPDVEQVVMIALEKDQHKRFGSILAFANALDQAYSHQAPTVLKPITPDPSPSQTSTFFIPPTVYARERPAAPAKGPTTPNVYAQPTGTLICKYQGHTAAVLSLVWSPDGRYIATAGNDRTAQVWEVSGARPVHTYQGHTAEVNSLTWSPDYTFIASGSNDSRVRVWNAKMGLTLYTYPDGTGWWGWTSAIAWSPDGKRLAAGGQSKILYTWDALTKGENIRVNYQGHDRAITSLCWSPDSTRIASGSGDSIVRVWNAGTYHNIFTCKGHNNSVSDVAWSPIGNFIASASLDRTVRIWHADNGNNYSAYNGHIAGVNTISWSPDGQRIASAGMDKTVHVWNALNGQRLFVYQGHVGPVRSVSWSPDGRYIASCGDDKTVQVWAAP